MILFICLVSVKSYAEGEDTFGVRILPDKMIENSNGTLEVYPLYDGNMFPNKIENIVFSSTDSNIVQVIGTENNDTGFITHIKIQANNPGTANIVLAAPGFSSQEFPITVYSDEAAPTNLLIKATPPTFSITGPKTGYFSVELVNSDGLPAPAETDIPVTVAATNNQILSLDTSHLTIKAGHYYTLGHFEVEQTGSAEIFATAPSFQSVSTTVTTTSADTPTIQAYVYPARINDFAGSTAYVVAQLKDSSNNEAIANQDIPISVLISNATATGLVNTSPQDQLISANGPLIIKKGDYEGYTTIEVKAGLNGTFNIGLSAPDGYTVSNHTAYPTDCAEITGCTEPSATTVQATPVQITTVPAQLLDDKSARLDTLPILATGNNELIGIMHLEDPYGRPVIASQDLKIEVDSSDTNYLSVSPVSMSRGEADAPVFAKVGNTAPPPSTTAGLPSLLSLHVITYNDTTVSAAINASSTSSLKLVADSIVPKPLSQSSFPLALYLTDSSNALADFPNDYNPTILPNDYFHIEPKKISNGDSIDIFDAKSLKSGSTTLNIIAGNYPASLVLSSVSSSPAALDLDYPTPMLANFNNLMEVQVLDSNSNPRYLDENTNLRFVSSNNSIVLPPSNITISKGSYYSNFSVTPKSAGIATISVIGDNLPLATYQVKVDTMSPNMTIKAPKFVMPEETFFANITAQRYGKPISGLNVNWKVSGASIQSADRITDQNGVANISMMSNSTGIISLDSTVSGFGFNPLELKGMIKINATENKPKSVNATNTTSTSTVMPSSKSFKINGIDPLPFAVVGTIAAGGVMLKKKSIHLLKKNTVSTK